MRGLRRLLVAGGLLCGLAVLGCASGGAKRIATVSVVSGHSVLSAIQNAEMALVCGRAGAPADPLCVPLPTHRQISTKLAVAFGLDGDVARLVRAVPAGQPQPAQIADMLVSISRLVNDVLELVPRSPQRESLVKSLEAAR